MQTPKSFEVAEERNWVLSKEEGRRKKERRWLEEANYERNLREQQGGLTAEEMKYLEVTST